MRPVRPGRNAAGKNTDISTSVMPMIGAEQLVHGADRRVMAAHALLDIMGGAFDDDDGVIDHDADRQHDREQRREIHAEAERRTSRRRRR